MRRRIPLILSLMVALTACSPYTPDSASPDDETPRLLAKPYIKPTAQEAWPKVRDFVADPAPTVHQKLFALESFARQYPDPGPQDETLPELLRTHRRLASEDLSQQESIMERAQVGGQKLYQQRVKEFTQLAPLYVGSYALFHLARRVNQPGQDPLPQSITLTQHGQTKSLTQNLSFHPGKVRQAFIVLMRRLTPDKVVEGTKNHTPRGHFTARQNQSLNQLLHDRLGGDLFNINKPGTLNKAALERLLAKLDFTPETDILGVKAREAYPLVKPLLQEALLTRKTVFSPGKEASIMERYTAILDTVQVQERHYSYQISSYYRELSDEHNFGQQSSEHSIMWTGFWVRRVHDGTAPVLIDFLSEKLRAFDPAMHQDMGL